MRNLFCRRSGPMIAAKFRRKRVGLMWGCRPIDGSLWTQRHLTGSSRDCECRIRGFHSSA
jgi:hypothetical protein